MLITFAIQRHRSAYVDSIRENVVLLTRDKRRMQLREKAILADTEIASLRQSWVGNHHITATGSWYRWAHRWQETNPSKERGTLASWVAGRALTRITSKRTDKREYVKVITKKNKDEVSYPNARQSGMDFLPLGICILTFYDTYCCLGFLPTTHTKFKPFLFCIAESYNAAIRLYSIAALYIAIW